MLAWFMIERRPTFQEVWRCEVVVVAAVSGLPAPEPSVFAM